jgi:prepilin-type N-terminal cleavage/methylation domain-containing protein
MVRSRMSSRGGFNLVEVMMAIAVLVVGFIAVMQALTIGSESLDTARKLQVANQIIAAEIEKLRGGDWSTIADFPAAGTITISRSGLISGDPALFALSNHTADLADDDTELCTLSRGFTCSFTRTYLRPAAASSATATFVKIVYTITWTSNTGRVHSHSTGAYLGKNGLHLSYQQS